MIYIVVDDRQARLIVESRDGVEIRDSQGNHLGFVAKGFFEEDLVLAKNRINSEQLRFCTKETIDHLRGLIE